MGLRGDDEQLTWEELRRRSRRRRTSNRRAEDDVESDEDDGNGDRGGQNSDGNSSDGQDASDSESLFSQTTSQYLAEQERHLQEAMDQLELALKVILCPLLGKWLGRKWAYWGESQSFRPTSGGRRVIASNTSKLFLQPILFPPHDPDCPA